MPGTDIPHVVHYCWFGGNPLGEKELACIESWKKFLPGYEIKRWDESNWNVRCCDYVSEAYGAKQWAFVSDYARFDILYRFGGIYFDTDVELIKPIDDILAHGPFMGFETDWGEGNKGSVNPGLGMAATPGLGICKEVVDSYSGNHFINADGSFNHTTIVTRTTDILLAHGLEGKPGIQDIAGVRIYPSEYFNPKDYLTGDITITRNTRSVNHYTASWQTQLERTTHILQARYLKKGMSRRKAEVLARLMATIKCHDLTFVRQKLRKIHSGNAGRP